MPSQTPRILSHLDRCVAGRLRSAPRCARVLVRCPVLGVASHVKLNHILSILLTPIIPGSCTRFIMRFGECGEVGTEAMVRLEKRGAQNTLQLMTVALLILT